MNRKWYLVLAITFMTALLMPALVHADSPEPGQKLFLPLLHAVPVDHPNRPPNPPSNPNPADGSTHVGLSATLGWTASDPDLDSLAFDVYFGTGNPPTGKVSEKQSAFTFSPGPLAAGTTYFWKIVAWDPAGLSTPGPVWTFTSGDGSMRLIPAGQFHMGCSDENNGSYSCPVSEIPLHTATLDAFLIDKFEVTNAQYAQFFSAGVCQPPDSYSSGTRPSYFNNPDFANYPVLHVSWDQASAYCTWAGKRLPSEAEWEKAARGTAQNLFPWGDSQPDCSLANSYNPAGNANCVGDTTEIGQHPDGASVYGVEDMAGNVSEWVKDWYSQNYYSESPEENPPGPLSGLYRVVRGGNYATNYYSLRTAFRSYENPSHRYAYLGIRCAADP